MTAVLQKDYAVIDRIFTEEIEKYPLNLLKITGVSPEITDVDTVLDTLMHDNFSTMADISTDPNANVGSTTFATVLQECQKGAMKLHFLKEIFRKAYVMWDEDTAKRILKKEIEGQLYFSDLHLYGAPYCYNYSAGVLMFKGLPFIPRIPSVPASHADTFIQHAVQLIMYASNHQSGACALTGFFVALSHYLKKDGITSRKTIIQLFQKFTYSVNQPVRFSAQTPFLNLSVFDRNYLDSLYGGFRYPDGSLMDPEAVIDLQKMYVEWFMDEMKEKGIIFTFPVLTVAVLLDKETRKPLDMEFFEWATRANAAYGTLNFYLSDRAGSLSSCCRLSNDIDLLQELGYINSFGAGGDGVGSTGVVTVNLPHAVWQAQKQGLPFEDVLKEAVQDAQRSSYIRNKLVRENISKGFLPLYDHGFIDINSQYCTVGICGMYEAARGLGVVSGTLQKDKIESYEKFAVDTLNIINNLNMQAAREYGVPFNLEQVPAEGQAVTLAAKDRMQGLQSDLTMYSNQWVPLAESNVDLFTRIKLAGTLDRACSGGAILHITTGTKVSAEVQKRLLLYCARMGVVYCALNYTLSKCRACGSITSVDISLCPECGGTDLEVYTRVVGFVTPVKQWHATRRDEFHRRKRYSDLDARQKEMVEIKDGGSPSETITDSTETPVAVAI